jgi:carbonic anhydrase
VPVNTNEFLDNFWTAAEDYSGVVNGYYNASTYAQQYEVELDNPVNPYTAFLPANKEYYHYNGSLTTYPCTEGIKWIVMAEPVRISPDDLTKLRESIATHPKTIISWQGNDNRPVQSLNGRTVLKYNGKDGVSADFRILL